MRSIGRRLSDASPTSVVENGCAASNPASMRIVEPELPQSSAAIRLAEMFPRIPRS